MIKTKTKKIAKKAQPSKNSKTFKILDRLGNPLTHEQQAFFSKEKTPFSPSFSPVKFTSKSSSGKQKATNTKEDKVFIKELSTTRYSLWREMTPGTEKESPYTLKLKRKVNQKKLTSISQKLDFEAGSDSEEFEFSVAADTLQKKARPSSQKTVMSGITAKEYIKAFGAEMVSQTKKEVNFHWAHRQAWFMNGAQSRKNLDAMTAAGNFQTLFKVESPIKHLLLTKQAQEIKVQGIVYFINTQQRIAKSITYHFFWDKDKSCTVEIDPLNIRFPSREETRAAKFVIEQEARSPSI